MCVYVVRVQREAEAGPEFVGIYLAEGVVQLEELVERCCSRFVCEYAEVPHGCLYDSDASGAAPLYQEASEPQFVSFEDLSDDWHELFGTDRLEWLNFCEAPWRNAEARGSAFAGARHALAA